RRPPLDTIAEYAEYRAQGGGETCTGCHMREVVRASVANAPVRRGHDHRFSGVRDADFIRRYITATLEVERGRLTVALANEAGHRVPTGEPARVLEIRASLWSGTSSVAEGVASIARRFDSVTLRDETDTSLLPREKRRIT